MNRVDLLRRSLFALSMIVLIVLWVRFPKPHTFAFDGLNKLFQSYSIVMNGFRAETLVYPGVDFDPDHTFDPVPWVVTLDDGQRVGAFPASFSFLATPFVVLDQTVGFGMEYSSLLSLVPLIGIWLLLLRWKLHPALLVAAFWGNFLWLQVFELSEYLLAAFLGFAGFTLFLEWKKRPDDLNKRKWSTHKAMAVLSGMVTASAVAFRHETIVYGCAIIASAASVQLLYRYKNGEFKRDEMQRIVYFSVGFAFILSMWFISNQLNYGHFLGPRYLVSTATHFPGLSETLHRYNALLFWSGWRIGLFAFTPLLLWPLLVRLLHMLRLKRETSFDKDILALSILLYILIMPAGVPNDGAGGFGPRFLIFAVLPGYVLIQQWLDESPSRARLFGVMFFALASLPMPLVLHKLQKLAAVQQKVVFEDYSRTPANIWVFPNLALYYYFGLSTIRQECYIVPPSEDMVDFVDRLRKVRPGKSIAVVSLNAAFVEAAEANLAGNTSTTGQESLRILRASHGHLPRLRQHLPEATVTTGVQTETLLIAP